MVGASAAYHLAAAGAGRVLLLERADHLAAGSTGACAGGFRFQFSSEVNVRLSQASVPMITGFTETHGLPLDVARDGYLFLVRNDRLWDDFVAANRLHAALGVEAELLTPEEAAALAPGDLARRARRRDLRPEGRDRRPVRTHAGLRDAGPPGGSGDRARASR